MSSNLLEAIKKIDMDSITEKNIKNIRVGLEKYNAIMQNVYNVDVSKNKSFQKMFNAFYKIRQRPAEFYEKFYMIFEECKNYKNISYKEILDKVYQSTQRMEKSFCSKILATISPNYPIWDKYILENLGLKEPYCYDKTRFCKYIVLYENIIDFYREYRNTEHSRKILRFFDTICPNSNINDVKKIDFIFWQIRN